MPVNQADYQALRQQFEADHGNVAQTAQILAGIDTDLAAQPIETVNLDAVVRTLIPQSINVPDLRNALIFAIDGSDNLNRPGILVNQGIAVATAYVNNAIRNSLVELSVLGCDDASQFDGAINPAQSQYYRTHQVLNREWRFKPTEFPNNLSNAQNGSLSENSNITTFQQVVDASQSVRNYTIAAHTGICTTYATAAINRFALRIGLNGPTNDGLNRVEVVSQIEGGAGHIYAILNRTGANLAVNQELPGSINWGQNCYVLDVWLGTIGHAYFFPAILPANANDLANRHFINNGTIRSIVDSNNFDWANDGAFGQPGANAGQANVLQPVLNAQLNANT